MTKMILFIVSIISCFFNIFGWVIQECPAGYSCLNKIRHLKNGDNQFVLVPCPPGTFSDVGQDDCDPCEPGYYASSSGSAFCTVCPPGFMCPSALQNPAPCPLGTYSPCTGQTCCSGCPPGTFTPRVGSIQCSSCPAGTRCPTSSTPTCGGDILSPQHQAIITKFMGKVNPKWKLIYKATRDGFRGAAFHNLCNNQTQTVSIIQSKNGYLFGGYAHAAWNSLNSYTNDPRAFIFTLTNPNSILPTRYLIKGGYEHYAFFNNNAYGPTFGAGHDIYVPDNSNAIDGYINFGHTYTDTTGKGAITFTGNSKYQTSEIEVYKILG